jgi:hypothetical protein
LPPSLATDAIVPVAAEIGGALARLRPGTARALPAARERETVVSGDDTRGDQVLVDLDKQRLVDLVVAVLAAISTICSCSQYVVPR